MFNCESFTRIGLLSDGIFRSVIQLVEKCSQFWFKRYKRFCRVWHKQAVIDDAPVLPAR